MTDWHEWHNEYDDSESRLARRLLIIQDQIRRELDQRSPGPIRVISICAGQGRDVVGVVAGHPRQDDVSARMVELDARLVEESNAMIDASGLSSIEAVAGDASLCSAYAGAVPADLILACGVLGNLRLSDARNAIGHFKSLASEGALVIWTYSTYLPDQTPAVRQSFADAGYEEVAFVPCLPMVVGVHRLRSEPTPFQDELKMFDFVGMFAARDFDPNADLEFESLAYGGKA